MPPDGRDERLWREVERDKKIVDKKNSLIIGTKS